MSEQKCASTDYERWDFPAFDPQAERMNQEIIVEPVADSEDVLEVQVPVIHPENGALQSRIQYLDAIGAEIKQTLKEVDAVFFTDMITLIKKTVKKILLRELTLDTNAFEQMVKASLDQIHQDDEICVIQVSPEDQPIFETMPSLEHITLKVSPELQKGDYLIKTKYSELEAILEQRVNSLFEV